MGFFKPFSLHSFSAAETKKKIFKAELFNLSRKNNKKDYCCVIFRNRAAAS